MSGLPISRDMAIGPPKLAGTSLVFSMFQVSE
jgi:hypothetical protein